MAPVTVTVLQSDFAGCTALDALEQYNGRSLVAKDKTVTGMDCMLEMCVKNVRSDVMTADQMCI